jgi:hypothetical protein
MLTAAGIPSNALGWNITFSDERNGQCQIRMTTGRYFKRRRVLTVSVDEVDALENALVRKLMAARIIKPRIKWKTDFYGRQWLEVRRGVFGRTTIRANPDRLSRLGDALKVTG